MQRKIKHTVERYRTVVISIVFFVLGFMLYLLHIHQFVEINIAGKTFWDWLDLLIIPIVLALGALLFNWRENKMQRELAKQQHDTDIQIAEKQREADRKIAEQDNEIEREIARAKRHEDILQHYFDKMTALMIDEDWLEKSSTVLAGEKAKDDEEIELSSKAKRLFDIARVQTVSALRALEGDNKRQTSIMHFLKEIDLYNPKDKPALLVKAIMSQINFSGLPLLYIDLHGASLDQANLEHAVFYQSSLQDTNLYKANLQFAFLYEANLKSSLLYEANLQHADLGRTNLQDAMLYRANLKAINLQHANLQQATLFDVNLQDANLKGANLTNALGFDKAEFNRETILPDETKWTPETDVTRFSNPGYSDFWQPDLIKNKYIYDYWQEQGWLDENSI